MANFRARLFIVTAFIASSIFFILLWLNYDYVAYWKDINFGRPTSELNRPAQPTSPERESVKKDWVDVSSRVVVGKPWDPEPIRKMCRATPFWSNDVYFECSDSQGGIGNVRQDILSCIRYAIDAGAGLLIPTITIRGEDLTDLNTQKMVEMDYLFDTPTFLARMQEACPQMKIVESRTALAAIAPLATTVLAPRDIQGDGNQTIMSINEEISRTRGPHGTITLVVFLITLAYFPICADPVPFIDQFGHLVPFRKDVHTIASSALYELSSRYDLSIDPASGISTSAYLGAHLRTDTDAIAAGWPTYEEQKSHILQVAHKARMPVLYVASGNVTSTAMLAAEAAKLHIPTVTKHDLLTIEELDSLKALSWDQQALVDWLILERSSLFCGIAESSFSWNMAVRRRVMSVGGSCAHREGKVKWGAENHGKLVDLEGVQEVYKDEYSDLIGARTSEWEIAMWP